MHVSYANFWAPIAMYVRDAFISLGLANIPGFNSGTLVGYSEFTSSIDPQASTRSSSETAFLQASITRPNLMLYQQTLANKILFDSSKNAVGVSVSTAGVPFVLSAGKEVILSAGVVRSQSSVLLKIFQLTSLSSVLLKCCYCLELALLQHSNLLISLWSLTFKGLGRIYM